MNHFAIPNTIKVLQRDSLTAFFKERKITLLSAAPGCGKSTTLAMFLMSQKRKYCWLNMDTNIGNVEDFRALLLSGLKNKISINPRPGELRKRENSSESINHLLRQTRLHHSEENPFCIVLDNFELTNSFPEIQVEAEKICLSTGKEIRFYFISREEIQYSFRKLRADRELLEIRTPEFFFHQEEIRELFKDFYGINLSEKDYEQIYENTGGWIIAMVFISERLLHKSSDERRLILDTYYAEKRLPELDDYIQYEVLKSLEKDEINLLVKLNKAGIMTPELIEEFSSIDGKTFLSNLEKKNLFIQIKDPGLYVYSFHSFFSEYLNREYLKLSSDERKNTLLILCEYFEKQNKHHLAIQHLLEGGESERALKYLSEYSEELMQTGEYETMRNLLVHFSENEIKENLLLSYYSSISKSIIHPTESQNVLMELLPRIRESEDYDREAKLYTVLLTSNFFYQTSSIIIGEVVKMASDFIEQHSRKISIDRIELLRALLPLGQWWISPAKDEAFEAALRAEEISHRFNNQEAFLCARLVLIRIYLERGDFNQAKHLLIKTETLLKTEKKYSHLQYYRTLLSFYLGDTLFYLGEIPQAIIEVQKGLSYAVRDFAFRPYLQLNLILYNLYLEDIEKAESLFNRLQDDSHGENEYLKLYFNHFFKMLIAYRNKNRRRTDYFCRRLLEPENKAILNIDYPFSHIALAEALIFLENYVEAENLLNGILDNLSTADYPHSTSSALGLSAVLENRRGRKNTAEIKAKNMVELLNEKEYRNLDICDPLILNELNSLTNNEALSDFPRLFLENELDAVETESKPLEIQTFGKFQVLIEGREISTTLLSSQKRIMDLVKFLIVFRKNGVKKERIYGLFWPRYSYKSARDNLNTIIYRLRKMLGDSRDYLITDANSIRLDLEHTSIDADRFLELFSAARTADESNKPLLAMKIYRECVAVYEGDFLEGDLYYDFIRDERENLQSNLRNALFRMIQLSLNSGEYTEAMVWAKKLIDADPLCEAAYRLLMICSSFTGSRSEIPRLFDKLNKKLQTYYKIQADEKTVDLKDRLLSGEIPEERVWMEETII